MAESQREASNRWSWGMKNQMSFLVKNLSYVYESGRLSVMELLNAVIQKFNDDLLDENADLLFVGLVMVLANDESAKCREKAAGLIKALLGRIGEQQKSSLMKHVHAWAEQKDKAALQRVSCQVYGLVLDVYQKEDPTAYLEVILSDTQEILKGCTVYSADLGEDSSSDEVEWQTAYQALTTLAKFLAKNSSLINQPLAALVPSSKSYVQWELITPHLLHPHTWVRTVSCRLLGTLFSTCPITVLRADSDSGDGVDSARSLLSFSGMKSLSKALCEQLKSRNLNEQLGLQIVKNLFFIGKCYCAMPGSENRTNATDHENENDESDGDEKEEEEDDQEIDNPDDGGKHREKTDGNPLPWLFSRLSYLARSAYIYRRNRQSSPVGVDHYFASISLTCSAFRKTGLSRFWLFSAGSQP